MPQGHFLEPDQYLAVLDALMDAHRELDASEDVSQRCIDKVERAIRIMQE